MEQFNFYIETSNGFKGNVVVNKYYDGLERFSAEVRPSFGFIVYYFDERDIYDIDSIEEIKEYITNKLEYDIDSRLEHSEKLFGVKCNTFSEYEIAFFDYIIDYLLKDEYGSGIDDIEAYKKASEIKSRMKFEKYGDRVRMVDEDGNWWDDVDEAVYAIIEKAE